MKPIKEMAADELTEWAKLHIMKWHPSKPFHNFHPATDWNDARRVLLAVPHSGEIEDAAGMFMIDPNSKPEHLLRYVCEQWEANRSDRKMIREAIDAGEQT